MESLACIHRYELETPNGPTSIGVCKLCGAVREFVNTPFIRHPYDTGLGTKYGDVMARLQIASRLVFDGHDKPQSSGWVR